jgi:hypothetical protein
MLVLMPCNFYIFFHNHKQKNQHHYKVMYIMGVAQSKAQRAQRFLGGTGKLYKPLLDHLMLFIVGQPFAWNYIYSDEELNAITPAHVLQWMNFRTFGTINPAVDANPISARSSPYSTGRKQYRSFIPTG